MLYRNSFLSLIVLLIFQCHGLFGQTRDQLDVLNIYVDFINESIHGMFTAHALLVINNKEINKYIDLDSYQLNNLTNNEVQSNLFAKSDKENYTTFQGYSPLQLMDLAKEKSTILDPALANQLNSTTDEIGKIINRVNTLRFELADYIENHDLNDKESIYGAFVILEECALMFENFAKQQRRIVAILSSAHKSGKADLFLKAQKIHSLNKAILLNLRNGKADVVSSTIEEFDNAVDQLASSLVGRSDYNKTNYKDYVKTRIDSVASHLKRYKNSSSVPTAYEIYGKDYYYHNQIAKRFFNWSGPGYVRYLNALMDELGIACVHFSEEPLIFKVVYPMELDEMNTLDRERRFKAAKQISIDNPEFSPVIERPTFNSTENILPAKEEAYTISFKVFDHSMMDRDTISLFLNGECILDKYDLRLGVKKFEVEIKRNQDYELEIRAENHGIIAPNTAAIGYRIKGHRKMHIIESSLSSGESVKVAIIP